MKPIKIIADSTCDLSPELLKEYDISICPLQVNLGEESRLDGVTIEPNEIYAWAEKNNKTPTTSAPSPESIDGILRKYSDDYDIIAFTISSEMSSTFQTFTVLAEKIQGAKIKVIDSRNLSTGIGLLIMTAAKMIKAGDDFDKIVNKVEELIPKVRAGFIVEDVLFLHKGGRCSAIAAYGATALKLRPTLKVVDGLIKPDKKVRGEIHAATLKYVDTIKEGIESARDDMVFITYSGNDLEIVDEIHQYLKGLNKFKDIYITRAGCVISSHCGNGSLGVLFIAQ